MLGVTVGDGFDSLAPPRAQLLAYRAAEWGSFGFGVVGTLPSSILVTLPEDHQQPSSVSSSAESELLESTTVRIKIFNLALPKL